MFCCCSLPCRPRLPLDRVDQPAARPGHPAPDSRHHRRAFPVCRAIPIAIGWHCFSEPASLTGSSWSLAAERQPRRVAGGRLSGGVLAGGAGDAAAVFVAGFSPADAARAFPAQAALGDRPGLRGGQPGRARPSSAGPPAAERNPATGRDRSSARRAAAGPGARRAVDRPSVRSALHRPRGQGLFPRGRSRQQRTSSPIWCASPATSSMSRRASTGLPTRWASLRPGTACISSSAITICASIPSRLRRTLEQSGLIDLGGRWLTNRDRAGRRSCWPATNGRGSPPAADLSDCPPPAPAGPAADRAGAHPRSVRLGPGARRRPAAGRPHARRPDSPSAAGRHLFAHPRRA